MSALNTLGRDPTYDVTNSFAESLGRFLHLTQPDLPQELLDYYYTLCEAAHSTPELLACAYNLPAVTLCLGKRKWPTLRSAHVKLSQCGHAPVRRSIAASLPAIAESIGVDQASADLVPVFRSLISDNDYEVQEMVVNSALSFVSFLNPEAANEVLLLLLQVALAPGASAHYQIRQSMASELCAFAAQLLTPLNYAVTRSWDLLCALLQDEIHSVAVAALPAVRWAPAMSEPELSLPLSLGCRLLPTIYRFSSHIQHPGG